MMSARGELSRTGKENRTLPTGVSVAMVQRAMPPGSRRIASTPPSISVKCERFEKKFFTACKGEATLSVPLNDERTRNMESEVGGQKSKDNAPRYQTATDKHAFDRSELLSN